MENKLLNKGEHIKTGYFDNRYKKIKKKKKEKKKHKKGSE